VITRFNTMPSARYVRWLRFLRASIVGTNRTAIAAGKVQFGPGVNRSGKDRYKAAMAANATSAGQRGSSFTMHDEYRITSAQAVWWPLCAV
jgi:hypothetical protein